MKLLNVILILFVPVLNIGLNTAAKKTANASSTFLCAFSLMGSFDFICDRDGHRAVFTRVPKLTIEAQYLNGMDHCVNPE